MKKATFELSMVDMLNIHGGLTYALASLKFRKEERDSLEKLFHKLEKRISESGDEETPSTGRTGKHTPFPSLDERRSTEK